MIKSKYNLITILGPTACGKTKFAALLADKINGEIISADSRQVYKRMDMGTGKDYSDYMVNNKLIPYHLIDIRVPGEKYNIFEYQNDFLQVYHAIKKKGKFPVLCGGSGMYIDAVTKGYKLLPVPPDKNLRKKLETKSLEELTEILSSYKKLHNITDVDTKKRAIRAIEIEMYYESHPEIDREFPDIFTLFLGIRYEREKIKKQITERLHARLKEGMIEEVENLLEEGLSPDDLIYYGLEYKFITMHVMGEMDYNTMVEKLNTAIHQFAKRQMTWFRKMEKEGVVIHWLEGDIPIEKRLEEAVKLIG